MQKHIDINDDENSISNVISLHRYRIKMKQARYYWNMTKCSYVGLSKQCGLSLPQARRWEILFTREHANRGKK